MTVGGVKVPGREVAITGWEVLHSVMRHFGQSKEGRDASGCGRWSRAPSTTMSSHVPVCSLFKENHDVFTMTQTRLRGVQRSVLTKCEEKRLEGSRLAPLPLWNMLCDAFREIRSCAPTPSINMTVATG